MTVTFCGHRNVPEPEIIKAWLNETVELPLDEDRFLEELNKRRATSRLKVDAGVVLDTEGTYGSKK